MAFFRILLVFVACAAVTLHAQTSVPTVDRAIPVQTLAPSGSTVALNLSDYFAVPGVSGQVVQFDTVLGKFNVMLRPDAAPQEAANFLGYVQRGDYANSFFHRSASLDGAGISIVQGGGYYLTSAGVATVPAQAPVPLEYNLPNARGTIAAARTSDINSATSQWYFNVRDNSTVLGPSNGGGYTVFGQVIGSGMTVVDAIAALPRVNAGAPFDELPVQNYTSGNVQNSNLVVVNSITSVPVFPTGSGPAVVSFSAQSSATGVVTPSITGSVLALSPGAAGNATVTVRAVDTNGSEADLTFAVNVAAVAPAFSIQPLSVTAASGSTVALTAGVTGADGYQWQRNGADVAGATSATFLIDNASSVDAGTYTLTARNSVGSTISSPATLSIVAAAPGDVGRLVNLSIRSNAGTGAQTLTVGFGVGGASAAGNMPLLLRAMGPSLAPFGVTGFLADPVATVYDGANVVASNDNWGGDPQIDARARQVGAFGFASPASLDAALNFSASVISYTMQISSNGAANGTALAEIYDATPTASITSTTPRLVNVSARTQVGTGDNILIAGFAVGGTTARTVLIRATGPALAPLGVTGTLADPKLQLYLFGSNTALAVNDDWGGDPEIAAVSSRVGAFPLTDGASKDAALLITLPPGTYSATVAGADGGTGVALIEVYEVP